MDETRRARLTSVIQEELSVLISREVKDPRVTSLTITSVKLNEDASVATVYIILLGSVGDDSPETQERVRQCLDGLRSCTGFLKRQIARAVTTRTIPNLIFKQDKGLDNAIRVNELLKQISGSGHES